MPERSAGEEGPSRALCAQLFGRTFADGTTEHEDETCACDVIAEALKAAQADAERRAFEEAAGLIERKHREGDTFIVAGLLRARAAASRQGGEGENK